LTGLVAGVAGTASVYLWSTSDYVGFHRNENLFWASPLTFGLVYVAWGLATQRAGAIHRAVWITRGLLAVAVAGVMLGMLPALGQDTGAHVGLWLPILVAVTWIAHVRAKPAEHRPPEGDAAAT